MSNQDFRSSVVHRVVMWVAVPMAVIFLIGSTVGWSVVAAGRAAIPPYPFDDRETAITIAAIMGGLVGFCIGTLVAAVVLTLSAIEKNTRNIATLLQRNPSPSRETA
jgi:hypothetical protein